MSKLKFFALFSADDKPQEIHNVIADETSAEWFNGGQHEFEGSIPLPLPEFLLIFALGEWPCDDGCQQMSAQVHLGKDLVPFHIGTLSKDNRALCWQGSWREDLNVRAVLMSDEGQPGLLVVTPTSPKPEHSAQEMCNHEPIKIEDSPDDTTDVFETSRTESQLMEFELELVRDVGVVENRVAAQRGTPPSRSGLRMLKVEVTPEVMVQLSQPPALVHSSRKKRKTDTDPSTPKTQSGVKRLQMQHGSRDLTKKSPSYSRTPSRTHSGPVPSARWGHSMCSISTKQALVIGGQGEQHALSKDSVWLLDIDSKSWCVPAIIQADSTKPQYRMGHTAIYDPMIKCVYVFGGSKNLRWYSDVHVLDIESWRWSHVEAKGRAPTRAYHTSTLHRNEMFVFGGVYPNPDPEPDGCSNQLHVFNPASESWYEPLIIGKRPKPRSGHSATLLGNRLVIFGGWDAPECFNDVHCLDLTLFEFENIPVIGTPPSPRSWHASAALPGNRIFIHGGFDGDNAMTDSYIFCLDTRSWSQVYIPIPMTPKAGHTIISVSHQFNIFGEDDNDDDDKENETNADDSRQRLIIFGGGNNEGTFSNKLTTFKLELAS